MGGLAHLNSLNYCEDEQEYLELQRAKTTYTSEPYEICMRCFTHDKFPADDTSFLTTKTISKKHWEESLSEKKKMTLIKEVIS